MVFVANFQSRERPTLELKQQMRSRDAAVIKHLLLRCVPHRAVAEDKYRIVSSRACAVQSEICTLKIGGGGDKLCRLQTTLADSSACRNDVRALLTLAAVQA